MSEKVDIFLALRAETVNWRWPGDVAPATKCVKFQGKETRRQRERSRRKKKRRGAWEEEWKGRKE